jgi:hypothetical protein
MGKIFVSYTYFNSPSSNYNLLFFTQKAIRYYDNIDYYIVINGHHCEVEIPNLPNVYVICRDNMGYDFGGHNAALQKASENGKKYDYYFFMNSGVTGPVIPHYISDDFHWTHYFIRKITEKVKLVGTSIVCLPKSDFGGYGPKIEGFFFMTDKVGLEILESEGSIFTDHQDKKSAILNGEYAMTKTIMKHGYTIDCMLHKYQNIDWLDEKNWNLNDNRHPSRHNSFYGHSINPYEVIFHKWYWHYDKNLSYDNRLVSFDILENYIENSTR